MSRLILSALDMPNRVSNLNKDYHVMISISKPRRVFNFFHGDEPDIHSDWYEFPLPLFFQSKGYEKNEKYLDSYVRYKNNYQPFYNRLKFSVVVLILLSIVEFFM